MTLDLLISYGEAASLQNLSRLVDKVFENGSIDVRNLAGLMCWGKALSRLSQMHWLKNKGVGSTLSLCPLWHMLGFSPF